MYKRQNEIYYYKKPCTIPMLFVGKKHHTLGIFVCKKLHINLKYLQGSHFRNSPG